MAKCERCIICGADRSEWGRDDDNGWICGRCRSHNDNDDPEGREAGDGETRE